MKENVYNAALTGVSDFFFNKRKKNDMRNRPAMWMNEEEKEAWKIGWNYAEALCNK